MILHRATGSHEAGRRGLLSNFVSLGVSSIAGSILALFATAHLARVLGVETFGTFNLARAVTEYALLPAGFGITVTASRIIARDSPSGMRLASSVVILRLLLGALGWLGVLAVALLVHDHELRRILLVTGLSIPFLATNVDWLYSAHEDQRWPGVVRTVGRAVYAGGILVMVAAPDDVGLAATAIVVEAAIVSVLMWMRATRWLSLRSADLYDFRGMWVHFRDSMPVGIAGLSVRLKTNADMLILGVLGTSAAVGYYSAAYRLVLFVNSLAGLYATVLLPRLSRARDESDGRDVFVAGHRISFLIGLLLAGGGTAVAAQAVVAFVGPDFQPAGQVMTILMAASGAIVVSLALSHTAVAHELERTYVWVVMIAAAANMVGNVAFIPLYGMNAAAVTTAVTEGGILIALCALLWRRGVRDIMMSRWFARAVISAGLVHLVARVCLWAGLGLLLTTALGSAAACVLVYALRLIDRRTLAVLTAGSEAK